MRIGVIVDNELNNDKRVLREIGILVAEGHEIFCLCYGINRKSYESIEGIVVRRIKMNRKIKDILFFFNNSIPLYEYLWSLRIKNFIKKYKPEALHVHDLYMSWAGWSGIINAGLEIPMILDLHENYPYAVTTYNWTKGFIRSSFSRPQIWKKKEEKYLGFADSFIVLSEDFRDVLIRRYSWLDYNKFIILPNVPDLDQMEPDKNITPRVSFEQGTVVLMYFGVVAERRGIFDVLDIIPDLTNENHNIAFLIIGPVDKKDKKRFLRLIDAAPLKDKVKYIPWIDMTELKSYLDITDICIAPFKKNPQHESGVANKIFDYMLGGKPVIVSDCGPQKKLIEKYKCGMVFKNGDELKATIVKLYENPILRNEMGENGYKAIINENNLKLIKHNLANLYLNINKD
jgi:glycosyltransferase involved in cell wall biosynthesis